MKKSSVFNQLLNRQRSGDGFTLKEEEFAQLPENSNFFKKKNVEFRQKPLNIRITSRLLFGDEKVNKYSISLKITI